jgi:hypothetical protein
MNEEWRTCPSWPCYEVSNRGRVRRTKPGRRGGFVGVRKPYLATTGYWYLAMRHDGFKKAVALHILIAESFVGPMPNGKPEVAHGDGNKLNNDPSNLRWVSRSENEADKILHGKSNRGERQGRSRLKAAQVLEIRRRLAVGEQQESIAAYFGIARTTVAELPDLTLADIA